MSQYLDLLGTTQRTFKVSLGNNFVVDLDADTLHSLLSGKSVDQSGDFGTLNSDVFAEGEITIQTMRSIIAQSHVGNGTDAIAGQQVQSVLSMVFLTDNSTMEEGHLYNGYLSMDAGAIVNSGLYAVNIGADISGTVNNGFRGFHFVPNIHTGAGVDTLFGSDVDPSLEETIDTMIGHRVAGNGPSSATNVSCFIVETQFDNDITNFRGYVFSPNQDGVALKGIHIQGSGDYSDSVIGGIFDVSGYTAVNELVALRTSGGLAQLLGGIQVSDTVSFFGVDQATQQVGGLATASVIYTSTEQTMLQKAYDCLRTFGFLS